MTFSMFCTKPRLQHHRCLIFPCDCPCHDDPTLTPEENVRYDWFEERDDDGEDE